ncbi:MAG: lipoprotein-releasing ABC transporter permease subunit [Planktomarina sp.]
MTHGAVPFSKFEFMIAWRYLKAKRSEGGVSVMTIISLVGIALAVAALIIVLAVRSGFRTEFVDIILGANSHITVYNSGTVTVTGTVDRTITDFQEMADRIATVPGVVRAAPLVRGQVMVSFGDRNAGVQVYGITAADLKTIPRIAQPEVSLGDIETFPLGIAIGSEVARTLGVTIGDRIKLISPNGVRTAFGVSPRVKSFTITYIFTAGRYDIDLTRVYLPFGDAQAFFNREGAADEIEVILEEPEQVDEILPDVLAQTDPRSFAQTWQDIAGGFLRALRIEDNVMFVIMGVLILLSTMNIVSGLIMLVKNKGKDIGILRTIGMSEGTILRVFFICGAGIGLVGTLLGVVLGVAFVINIDFIFSFINYLSGGGVWDPSIRGIYELPAELRLADVLKAVAMSLGLSFLITIFPARRAARMNPVEALRYE